MMGGMYWLYSMVIGSLQCLIFLLALNIPHDCLVSMFEAFGILVGFAVDTRQSEQGSVAVFRGE